MSVYEIKKTSFGVELLKDNRVLSSYSVNQLKNGKWKVRLSGSQYGFSIFEIYPASSKLENILKSCEIDLREIQKLDSTQY